MEFIGHLFLGIFIALIVFATVTFGFALFIWFTAVAAAAALLFFMRSWIRRLWFLYHARDHAPHRPPHVIDVDYRDISDEE